MTRQFLATIGGTALFDFLVRMQEPERELETLLENMDLKKSEAASS